ncbi:hypothetical protein GUJ93_ZPchr0014g47117 [Zizania palustris]|uniref:Uncharacterized protein n=1 Tax=Zizania palustris TaxID=103762 RepID=A0A8J5VS31_ZIZPA|nr:hypothetical protein GUJ93_ZPchr0014g47117 [Zizania palustris]
MWLHSLAATRSPTHHHESTSHDPAARSSVVCPIRPSPSATYESTMPQPRHGPSAVTRSVTPTRHRTSTSHGSTAPRIHLLPHLVISLRRLCRLPHVIDRCSDAQDYDFFLVL